MTTLKAIPDPNNKTSNGAVSLIVHETPDRGYVRIRTWAMQCCGLGEITNLAWAAEFVVRYGKAEFLAALYEAMSLSGVYQCWNFVYTTPTGGNIGPFHDLMAELGAVKMGEPFKNEAHGPSYLQIWRFNLKKAIEKYITYSGEPITTQPENKSATVTAAIAQPA